MQLPSNFDNLSGAVKEVNKIRRDSMRIIRLSVLAVLTIAFGALASAQTRTWVSGVGDDANPCSRTAPCKTFAGAISKTAAAGEINCIDPGGFGALTITKSITIDCDGTFGSVLVAGTNGIVVAAQPTDVVTLRGLFLNGTGSGINGISFISGSALNLERVTVFGFTTNCVDVETGTSAAQIRIDHSSLQGCTTGGLNLATTNGSTINADLNEVRISHTGNAINAGNGARVTIRNSVLTQNSFGVNQPSQPGGSGSQVLIFMSTISDSSSVGFQGVTGGYIGVSGCTLTYNNLVYNINGGTILTGNDNVGFGNPATGSTSGLLPRI
jgi:hypothetical protein